MSVKLFVGNLPYSVNSDELREYFAQAGNVIDAVVIIDRNTGQSRGFGFVEFATEKEALSAIQKFDGSSFAGRNIVVNKAKPKNR